MTISQNRPAPAYLEYASNVLANAIFRGASLEAKGLLYQLKLECWANADCVPSNPNLLSKYLGVSVDDLSAYFPEIEKFFTTDAGWLRCKELDGYRAYLAQCRKKQSEGGKKGAAKTNAARSQGTRGSLIKTKLDQISSDQTSSVIKDANELDESWRRFQDEPDDDTFV